MATVMELDPIFVKALRLLHSRSKDSTEQLKQMLDEALGRRKGDDSSNKESYDYSSDKYSTKKEKEASDSKRRESEKRNIEKLQQDLADLSEEVPTKKAKLETGYTSEGSATSKKERDADRAREKERSKEKAAKEREKERAREKEREERARERELEEELEQEERERIRWEQITKSTTADSDSDTDSYHDPGETDIKESSSSSMDVGDFALCQGISCVVCQQFDVSSGNQLVECQECHSLYHQECHRPPVIENNVNDPRFVWYCSKCLKNLKKNAAAKPQKPKPNAPATTRETMSLTRGVKPEPSIQPFRRLETSKPSVAKEGGATSSGRPLMGLASLAANLSGKEKHGKSAGHKSPSSTSGAPPSLSRSDSTSGKSPTSLLKPDLMKGKDSGRSGSGSAKTESKGLGLGAMARPDVASKSSAKRDVVIKPGQSLLAKPTTISSVNAFAQSSFGAALTSGLAAKPSANKPVAGSRGDAAGPGAQKMPQMMSADKRLQNMKKKAAARLQEKRSLPK